MTKRNSSKATITIKSPAKINLTLNVVSKRKDGYHNLETIMIPVSLWDEMEILTTNSKKIKIICDNKELPVDDDNIINRAIRLLWDVTGLKIGVLVKLKKNIPVAAGLGGGSSNGASVLLALNKLWKTGLTISRLTEIGKKLGADVPFFVHGKTALVKGIGEKIYPIKIKRDFWSVLVNPGFPVSTAWIYKNLNLPLTKKAKNNNKLTSLLEKGERPDLWSKYLFNDL
ncbi:MAG: 4-(cytidine 5'-diphospho)-2-C-methyl-D-erythritol kinase, partial [Candidatus Schekmanbacteria bacterium RBG_16_38_10]